MGLPALELATLTLVTTSVMHVIVNVQPVQDPQTPSVYLVQVLGIYRGLHAGQPALEEPGEMELQIHVMPVMGTAQHVMVGAIAAVQVAQD